MFNILKKLALKNKILVVVIVFILIIGGLVYFIVWPSFSEIQRISQEIENQRIDLEKKYQRGQNLKQLTIDLKRIEPQLDMLDNILIKQDHELEFITTLEDLAKKNNISQKINLSSGQNESSAYQDIPLTISANGSFINIMDYLLGLEALNYYINIHSISLKTSGKNIFAVPNEKISDNNISLAFSGYAYSKVDNSKLE